MIHLNSDLGIFVDGQGRKTRDKELMFPALPTGISMYINFYENFYL